MVGREANANTGAAAIGLDVGLNWAVSFTKKILGWPKRCKLAHALLWEHSYKGMKLAQLLGQPSVFLTFGPSLEGSLLARAPILLGGALVTGLTTRTFGFFGLNENILAACIVPKWKWLIPFM